MISKSVVLLMICQTIICHPRTIKLPDITDKVQPAEVNSLEQHNHHVRSIANAPDLYSQNNVEETIKEVENMLKANPTLPRLTRGEILDLLENITKTDMQKNKITSSKDQNKERDPKAVMVVMPYTPANENGNNMEELFTKPPVTHIVGAEPFKKTKEDYSFKRIPSEISEIPELGNSKKYAVEIEKSRRGSVVPQKPKLSTSTSTPTSTISLSTSDSSEPIQSTAKRSSHRRRRPPTPAGNLPTATPLPTTYHPTRRPLRRRPTTERYPNHKYPDEPSTESLKERTEIPSDGIRIITPPQFTASELNEDLQMQENRQPDLYFQQIGKDSFDKPTHDKVIVNDVIIKASTSTPSVDLIPDKLDTKKPSRKPLRSSATTTRTPSQKEEDNRIKQMLASFGVRPFKTTSTTTPLPDISNVADNLTPEMRDLLMSFGLISDPNEQKPVSTSTTTEQVFSFNPVKAEVKPDDYAGFKPLPEDDYSRSDMEELLARFGLGRNARKEKSLPKKRENGKEEEEKENLNFEVVPEQYLDVLKNIGLTDREGKMIRAEPLVKTQDKQHVFNPEEPQYATSEELEKLNKLLNVVKQLERLNGSTSEEDLKKVDMDSLKELISSLNEENKVVPLDEQQAPNPVNFDFSLEKNEVKRQENSTTTTAPPSTTTKEPQNGDIKDLEASFGGQADTTPSTEAPTPETTTQGRRTGFYYLVDWNTFLDIDDQKGKRVNLRFQPTVGDPKRFYSISVP